jgi:hypothetical protein
LLILRGFIGESLMGVDLNSECWFGFGKDLYNWDSFAFLETVRDFNEVAEGR